MVGDGDDDDDDDDDDDEEEEEDEMSHKKREKDRNKSSIIRKTEIVKRPAWDALFDLRNHSSGLNFPFQHSQCFLHPSPHVLDGFCF